jgi:hypothetical protein
MQVLLADVMVHPIDPAFQRRKISLDGVCGDAHAVLVPHVFIGSVVHLIVLASLERTRENGRAIRHHMGGGVWRIPPSFDGCTRSPLPRFTVLSEEERASMRRFFAEFGRRALRVLVPGGHLFIAANPLLSHLVYLPLMESGFGKRGEIIRLEGRYSVSE